MSKGQAARLSGQRLDVVVGALTLVLNIGVGAARSASDPLPLYAWIVLAVGPVAIMFWRRFPRAVMLVAVLGMVASAHLALGPAPAIPALIGIATAMYRGYRTLAIIAVLCLSVFASMGSWREAGWQFTSDVAQQSMLVIGWLHVALVTGESRRQRAAYMEEAERTKDEAVRRKAADERVRIARELHDSLTHSISVIRVQAGVAVHLARKRNEQPAEALVAVEEAAKDATRELRETLTMLRDDEGLRLARVKELAGRYDGLGFDIVLDCADCDDLDVDHEVDHAAYRIVQESLTNAVRHSEGDRVAVSVTRSDDALDIEVADNGRVGEFQPGRGITGMRERVDSLGGSLVVGPGRHGFTVRAQLPARLQTTAAIGSAE